MAYEFLAEFARHFADSLLTIAGALGVSGMVVVGVRLIAAGAEWVVQKIKG